MVIAPSFARIFRQNMFNCGMMAVEMPEEIIDRLFSEFSTLETQVETDFENSKLIFKTESKEEALSFSISSFDRELVKAGGCGWIMRMRSTDTD